MPYMLSPTHLTAAIVSGQGRLRTHNMYPFALKPKPRLTFGLA